MPATKNHTITAKELCELSGLSDRRHRQLSQDGFFPAAVKGNYQLTPTIQGLLKFYRESFQQSPLNQERMLKIQAERELLTIQIREKQRELVAASEFLEVAQRGLQAMTATVMSLTHVSIEDREKIINQLREAGESVCSVPGDV